MLTLWSAEFLKTSCLCFCRVLWLICIGLHILMGRISSYLNLTNKISFTFFQLLRLLWCIIRLVCIIPYRWMSTTQSFWFILQQSRRDNILCLDFFVIFKVHISSILIRWKFYLLVNNKRYRGLFIDCLNTILSLGFNNFHGRFLFENTIIRWSIFC